MTTIPADDAHILIVDDEAVIVNYLRQVLQTMGFLPVTATGGEEAVACLAKDRFTLVLTDMSMPGMDGMALLAHIRAHCPDTEVMIMTGFADQYAYEKVIRAGAVDYIVKPIKEFELKAKLWRIVRDNGICRQLRQEIVNRQQAELALTQVNAELEQRVASRTAELLETNTALRVMLKRRDEEQRELREEIKQSILAVLTPCLESLVKVAPPALISSLQSTHLALNRMLSEPNPGSPPIIPLALTPRERQVFGLIEQGHSSRQIASALGLSIRTVESHRDQIRKKIGIGNKKSNLKKIITLHK